MAGAKRGVGITSQERRDAAGARTDFRVRAELWAKWREDGFRFTSRKSIQLGNAISTQPAFPRGHAGRG